MRARAACGILGPISFTAAWLVCTLRQQGRDGYSVRAEHVSGLAASDANAPGVMGAGFVALGSCTIAFASAVQDALRGGTGDPAAPRLLRAGGGAAVAAALLRRDRMLLGPPPGVPDWRQSWRNHGHDAASGLGYACMIAAPASLVPRCTRDPVWRPLLAPMATGSLATAALLAVFASGVVAHLNGLVQRAALTIPLVQMAAVAAMLVRAARPAR
jgi:hypothetical protein